MPATWTSPRTWVAGELITASIGNSAWRDNFMYLKDSPVFDGTPTSTGAFTFTAAIISNSATDATSTLTGAIQTDGGLGVVKALWVGGLANIAGAVTLQSTLNVTGTITGNLTGNVTGNLTGNVTGNVSGTAPAGSLTGTTLAANVVTSSLTTVGALNAGSITSGFGAIDVGAEAISGGAISGTTGTFSGNLIFTASTVIRSNSSDASDNRSLTITAGGASGVDRGGFINVFGNEASSPGKVQIVGGNVTGGVIEFLTGNAVLQGTMHLSGGFSWGDATDPGDNNFRVAGTSALVGAVTASSTLTATGAINSDSTTDSTSITTGSLQTDGGLGVVKALWVGGLANIAGAVTLQSTLTAGGNFIMGSNWLSGDGGNEGIQVASNGSIATSINAAASTITCTNSHNLNPLGIFVVYSAAAPNDTAHVFFSASDTGATRAEIRSNGGLANFSANDVNLSDATTKDITGDAGAERERFRQLHLVRARYKDSTRNCDDVMVTAQDVETIYPELVTWFDEARQLKGVREHGLMMRAFKVIQELDDEVTALRALVEKTH